MNIYAILDKATHMENIRGLNLAAVTCRLFKCLNCRGSVNCYYCCIEPGLTGALYVLYIHDFIC
jgi:hypothetical protein